MSKILATYLLIGLSIVLLQSFQPLRVMESPSDLTVLTDSGSLKYIVVSHCSLNRILICFNFIISACSSKSTVSLIGLLLPLYCLV